MSAKILCIETSALACSVAIGDDDALLASKMYDGAWKHSREVTLLIAACLKEANLMMDEISAVAISGGPGSYTGLRVGASAAKGICYTKSIPLIALETLKIIAFPHVKDLGAGSFIIPMIDARRDEVYYNIYDNELAGQIETTNLIINESSLSNYHSKDCIICGDGAEKAEKLLINDANNDQMQSFSFRSNIALAENMVQLAYNSYKSGQFEDLAYYSPFYLKPPNITKSKKQLF
ncbi:MAG: tRNA (adenosine(37)-N6)-threonylcarbamoyltransferase complex dimerization subunit type 1 TsaB [Saprospiraceae bacterium]|nr:tRNA (adenosine(37)-N6)-threonylcarbamoyltransferase complex dimerization subunit type 1 TsaB [Saprospiraceae bacterium]